jgi:hypothetical protein
MVFVRLGPHKRPFDMFGKMPSRFTPSLLRHFGTRVLVSTSVMETAQSDPAPAREKSACRHEARAKATPGHAGRDKPRADPSADNAERWPSCVLLAAVAASHCDPGTCDDSRHTPRSASSARSIILS